jgi:integrase
MRDPATHHPGRIRRPQPAGHGDVATERRSTVRNARPTTPGQRPSTQATTATGHSLAAVDAGEGQLDRRRELTELARGYAQDSRAESTWRVYEARWARFVTWCDAQGERALPADPLTICRFLADLAPRWRPAAPADPVTDIVSGHVLVRPGLRPDSVAGYLAAISVAHQTATAQNVAATTTATTAATATVAATAAATTEADRLWPRPGGGHGQPGAAPGLVELDALASTAGDAAGESWANPARHEAVLRVLAGIGRQPTVRPTRRRDALSPTDLETILARLDPGESLADARDAALLLIGWNAGLRTDDLARLDITDIVVVPDQGLIVHLRRSKSDQTGAGATLGLTAADESGDPLDPVPAWVRWRNRLASHGLHTGPAWRGIDRYGRRPRATRMTTKSINLIVTRRAADAGLKGDIGGHSLRRGMATSALAAGAPKDRVQQHGRWRSAASMNPYIDAAQLFDADNPTRYLRRGRGNHSTRATDRET